MTHPETSLQPPLPKTERNEAQARVDFLVLTALREELDALLHLEPLLAERPKRDGGTHTFFAGHLSTGGGQTLHVVSTCLTGMGPLRAAAETAAILLNWQPRNVLLVGIAGGRRKRVRLGDLLLAEQVVDYTLGKRLRDKAEARREVRWESFRCDTSLLDTANHVGCHWITRIRLHHLADGGPTVHRGVIASGGDVISDKRFIEEWKDLWSKLVGVEMEGGGAATAVSSSESRPRFLMIRGVSDYADSKKEKKERVRRAYACQVAAAFALELISRSPPAPPIAPTVVAKTSRDRDLRTVERFWGSTPVAVFDHFFERAALGYIPDEVFFFSAEIEAIVESSAFYLEDPVLRKAVGEFSVALRRALGFGDFFESLPGGREYRFTSKDRHPRATDWQLARQDYERAVDDARKAFRTLVDCTRAKFPELDLNESSRKALQRRDEFYSDLERQHGVTDAELLDQGIERLLDLAVQQIARSSSEEVSVALELETPLEEDAAHRLVAMGVGKIERRTLHVTRKELKKLRGAPWIP